MLKNICLIALAGLLLFAGCSHPSPVTPVDNTQPDAQDAIQSFEAFNDGIQQIVMSGRMEISPDITNPIRDNQLNYNITSFLSTGCPGGCFRYRILNIIGTVFEIELMVENPTSLQVYDLKLIYEDLHGKKVLNPDSYTDAFKPYNVRPFTAFAKENASRAFPTGPHASDTEILKLDYPSGAQPYVDFIIIASFPNQTQEPYEIRDQEQDGTLTPSGGSAKIACTVLDHQTNVSLVAVNTTPLTGGLTYLDPDPEFVGRYSKIITNSSGVPAGQYQCLIGATSPNPQNFITYNYIDIKVTGEVSGWKDIEEVHLSADGWYSIDPDVAFDSRGFTHIVWTEVQNTGYMEWNENIWYSNNKSGSWSDPIELSDAFQNTNDYIVSPSAIAINNQDQICVVWSQVLFNGDRAKMWWNFYNGDSWMGQTQMFDLTNIEVQPQLCSADQFFYLAFRFGFQCGDILFSKWDSSNKWGLLANVQDPIDSLYELDMNGKCAITAASRGGIFITWLFKAISSEAKWTVVVDESWDGGTTWGGDQHNVYDEYFTASMPSIAMTGGGKVFDLWQTENSEIRLDQKGTTGWGTDQILYNKVDPMFPTFSIMPSGHQHVCFINSKIMPMPLYYIESTDSTTWTEPLQISPDEGECEMPSVATLGNTKVGVTWKQHLGQYSNDILYREKVVE